MPRTTLSVREVQSRLDELVQQDRPFTDTATVALDLGTDFLNTDYGYLTVTETESGYWKPIVTSPTAETPLIEPLPNLSDTYCYQTIKAEEQVSFYDAPNQGLADSRAFQIFGHHCYLGTPLFVDDEQYGTVCFVAGDPREEPFSDSELLVADLITRVLGYELESAQTNRKLRIQRNLTTVLNRVLRHNLRNNMTVIRGCATQISETILDDKYKDRLFKSIDQLIELGDKARELESVFEETAAPQSTDLESLVDYTVEKLQDEYPSASISIEASKSIAVSVRPSFETALTELLENAAKHGDEQPTVTVRIERAPDTTRIEIADDGPGLPKQEQEVLTNEVETPLVHGSGLGLWLVYWIVTAHGGDLESTVSEEGTTMTISLPRVPNASSNAELSDQLPDLMRSRDRYRAVFEESNEAMVITNDDAQIIDANPAASTVFEVETDFLLGRSLPEILPESFDFDTVWSTFRTGGVIRDTMTVANEDGNKRTLEYIGTADIVPGQHLLIVHDITVCLREET